LINFPNGSEGGVMIQWKQCYDCWTIFSIFKETEVFPLLSNGVRPIKTD